MRIREAEQFELLQEFKKFFSDFLSGPQSELRYRTPNLYFGYNDALMLYCMMRKFRPSYVVEVGSGYSSMVMLDTNERFLSNGTNIVFIEPCSERFDSLLHHNDKPNLIKKQVQDVPKEVFGKLKRGDMLFIDSSHVSKHGSDVNYLLFEILPTLPVGVIVHFHDVFDGFEYPEAWIEQRRNWNEIYLLHALFSNNDMYEVMLFNNYMGKLHKKFYKEYAPLALENIGASFYVRKIK